MRINAVLRGAVTATVATLALTGCGGAGDSGETEASGGKARASTSASATVSASASPTPSPTLHTKIGPLLAATDALIKKDPSVSFQIEDTEGGDPTLDAGGEIVIRKPLAARVFIDDSDGYRDLVVLDGKAYDNEGEAGSPTWRKTGFKDAEADVYELAVHLLIPALKAGVTTVTSKGTVEEAGTPLVHYAYTANTKATLDAMDLHLIDGKAPKQITGELWVHGETGDLRRVHMVLGGIRHNVDVEYGVSANIVAPPL
ncbi:hypothetical protein ACOCJ4_06940 [Knoellia sp. CPCC 206435]|uniref:hypothetical protein n=1 Tax=Knoellia terrae TaxID=3404797 RepID=UPI003B42A562